MRLIYDEQLYRIASAGLRCGRWAIKHSLNKKPKSKKEIFDIGYHSGKCYSYLWTLVEFGIVTGLNWTIVPDYENFLSQHYRGYIRLFPGEYHYDLLMKKKFFEAVLKSKQPHQGKTIIKEIRKMCPEIK